MPDDTLKHSECRQPSAIDGKIVALLQQGDETCLRALWNDMKTKDWFMALLDVEEYTAVRNRLLSDYEDRTEWSKKMLINTAKSGFFSSDRTIAQYNHDIWHLD